MKHRQKLIFRRELSWARSFSGALMMEIGVNDLTDDEIAAQARTIAGLDNGELETPLARATMKLETLKVEALKNALGKYASGYVKTGEEGKKAGLQAQLSAHFLTHPDHVRDFWRTRRRTPSKSF
jgi:hypothetical protein